MTAEEQLAEILLELQAVRVDMSVYAMILTASLLLLAGVVVGVGVGLVVKGWFK